MVNNKLASCTNAKIANSIVALTIDIEDKTALNVAIDNADRMLTKTGRRQFVQQAGVVLLYKVEAPFGAVSWGNIAVSPIAMLHREAVENSEHEELAVGDLPIDVSDTDELPTVTRDQVIDLLRTLRTKHVMQPFMRGNLSTSSAIECPSPSCDGHAHSAGKEHTGKSNKSIHQQQRKSGMFSYVDSETLQSPERKAALKSDGDKLTGGSNATMAALAKTSMAEDNRGDNVLRFPITPTGPSSATPVEEPFPLVTNLLEQEAYPVEALGPTMHMATRAFAEDVQVPLAMAAQSVLATASLAAQAHHDIKNPLLPEDASGSPLSLFCITIAASGDRKSTLDNFVSKEVRKYEKKLATAMAEVQGELKRAKAASKGKKRQSRHGSRVEENPTDAEEHLSLISKLADQLDPVDLAQDKLNGTYFPTIIFGDPTIEGLSVAFERASPSIAIMNDEGGQFLGGHAMKSENKLATCAALSKLWDGKPLDRARRIDKELVRFDGRRVAFHLMVQPRVSNKLLADESVEDQGLLNRCCISQPDSIAGSRFSHCIPASTQEERAGAQRLYHESIRQLLERSLPTAHYDPRVLEPGLLVLDRACEEVLRKFHNDFEAKILTDFKSIRGYVAKTTEHALRIAGVIASIENPRNPIVTEEIMVGACQLATWYAREALRLFGGVTEDVELMRAYKVWDWLKSSSAKTAREFRSSGRISIRDIVTFGPKPCRSKKLAEKAADTLVENGYLERNGEDYLSRFAEIPQAA